MKNQVVKEGILIWIFWLMIRLFLSAVGALLRLGTGKGKRGEKRTHKSQSVYVHTTTNKGRVTSLSLGVPYKGPELRFSPESKSDRFFKALGLSTEIQAGDREFDDKVYVISNHPLVQTHLQLNKNARKNILDALENHCKEIVCDGDTLWMEMKHLEETDQDLDHLLELRSSLKELESSETKLYRDPFILRAVAIEAVIWSFAGYALGGLIDFAFSNKTVFLNRTDMLLSGLVTAGVLFALLLTITFLVMRGSSRGHRVVVESAIVLLISMPLAGVRLLGDLNIGLDKSPPREILVERVGKEKRLHKDKNGVHYTYHLHLGNHGSEMVFPEEVQVESEVFARGGKDDQLVLVVRDGALSQPWLESVRWVRQ